MTRRILLPNFWNSWQPDYRGRISIRFSTAREIARLSRKRAPFKGIFVGGHKGSGIHASRRKIDRLIVISTYHSLSNRLNYNRVNWNIWLFLLYIRGRRKKFSIRRRGGKFARDFRRHAVFDRGKTRGGSNNTL